MRLCTIRGVEIRGGPLLLLALTVCCVLGRLEAMLQAILALALHEAAHVIVAAAFEQKIAAVELQPFGCVARMRNAELSPHAELCIAVAGPVVSFIAAGAAAAAAGMLPRTAFRMDAFLSFNATLALVNLLPALPLDGGRIVNALLKEHIGSTRAQKLMGGAGVVCGALMLLAGGVLLYFDTMNLTLWMMGLFLLVSAIGELRRTPDNRLGGVLRRGETMDRGEAMRVTELAVRPAMRAREALRLLQTNRFHVLRVIDPGSNRTIGEVDEAQLVMAIAREGLSVTVGDILSAFFSGEKGAAEKG